MASQRLFLACGDRAHPIRMHRLIAWGGCTPSVAAARASLSRANGAADVSAYRLVGTKGTPRMDAAYEYSQALRHEVVIGTRKRVQFAPSCYTSRPASCTIA